MKQQIIQNLCYTELVYGRINKKLKTGYSRPEIESLMLQVLEETDESDFVKRGKNYYITNRNHGISGGNTTKHLLTRVANFFIDNLK